MTKSEQNRTAQLGSAAARRKATFDAVVGALKARPQGASNHWLVAQTGRSKSTVNRTLHTLIADGVAERFADPYDGRTDRYRLTEGK